MAQRWNDEARWASCGSEFHRGGVTAKNYPPAEFHWPGGPPRELLLLNEAHKEDSNRGESLKYSGISQTQPFELGTERDGSNVIQRTGSPRHSCRCVLPELSFP